MTDASSTKPWSMSVPISFIVALYMLLSIMNLKTA